MTDNERAEMYYKATRPDGRDFRTGTIDYAAALASGEVIRHPAAKKVRDDASTYLSVSIAAADCTGFSWPCRLFRVEPVGQVMANLSASPNKRALSALRVVEELPAHMAFGPNGEAVVAFIDRVSKMTAEEARKVAARVAARGAAWYAAGDAAGYGARVAAWDAAGYAARVAAYYAAGDGAGDAAWYAARDGARDAAGDAAWALVVRDLITPEQYAVLVRPFAGAGLEEWVA